MSEHSDSEQPSAACGAEMATDATLAFLADRGVGVLSLAGDPPCALPMSFAVDASTGRFVFQFLSGPDSEKDDYIADGASASLVAFERSTPDDWASGVVAGELAAVERTPERVAAFAGHARSVGMSVFGAEAGDLKGSWYELRPTSVTGRCGPDWEWANRFGEIG